MLLVIFLLPAFFTAQAQSALPQDLAIQAKLEHKPVLLIFSGSDWCLPCIRLDKEVLQSAAFQEYAGAHLLVLKADFPRLRRHALTTDLVRRNELLADRYNPKGSFPLLLLLTEDGSVLRRWDNPPADAGQFCTQLNDALK